MKKVEMIIPQRLGHFIPKISMSLSMQGFFIVVNGGIIGIESSRNSPTLETLFSPDKISMLLEKGIQVKIID